jgi:hypothetical protein
MYRKNAELSHALSSKIFLILSTPWGAQWGKTSMMKEPSLPVLLSIRTSKRALNEANASAGFEAALASDEAINRDKTMDNILLSDLDSCILVAKTPSLTLNFSQFPSLFQWISLY